MLGFLWLSIVGYWQLGVVVKSKPITPYKIFF